MALEIFEDPHCKLPPRVQLRVQLCLFKLLHLLGNFGYLLLRTVPGDEDIALHQERQISFPDFQHPGQQPLVLLAEPVLGQVGGHWRPALVDYELAGVVKI